MKALQRKFLAALLALSLLAGLLPATGTTAQAAVAVIGETVNFAGHEWYIIGTPSEGVTAPAAAIPSLPKTTTLAHRKDHGKALEIVSLTKSSAKSTESFQATRAILR